MSAGGSVDRCEPNLTPMLDLVLQLVMFFMLCANFVMDSVNEAIILPKAIAAKPIDRETVSYEILNIDKDGKVLLGKSNTSRLEGRIAVRKHMANVYEVAERLAKQDTKKWADWNANPPKGHPVVILRAHEQCNYKMVHEVMEGCRDAKFTDIQLRVKQVTGN